MLVISVLLHFYYYLFIKRYVLSILLHLGLLLFHVLPLLISLLISPLLIDQHASFHIGKLWVILVQDLGGLHILFSDLLATSASTVRFKGAY